MAEPASAEGGWSRRAERGSPRALAAGVWLARRAGRRATRTLLGPLAAFFLATDPRLRRNSRRFLARALGRPATWRDSLRHIHTFAATVLDRLWLASGDLQRFEIELHGEQALEAMLARGRGGVLLGAHIGSFEALHAVGDRLSGLRVAMAMYPDNARMVQQGLATLAPAAQLDIIPIGQPASTLRIRDWLDGGGIVGMLGDRFLPGEAAATVVRPFLGEPVRWSDGPIRLAALLRRPLWFMVGVYRGGARYEVRFETLADFSDVAPEQREAAIDAALTAYVERLQALARQHPFNWFNFHDVWDA